MLLNDTDFLIDRGLVNGEMKWRVMNGNEMLCHSETYNGAVRAAEEIQDGSITPIQATRVSSVTIREAFRFEHYGKVVAERARLHFR